MNKLKIALSFFLMLTISITAGAQAKKTTTKTKTKVTTGRTQVKRVTTTKTKTTATVTPTTPAPGTRVKITTDYGVMVVRLYDKTPKHRDNFIKLAESHFFDSLLFHRVINGFMIQGGDPLSKTAAPGAPLGMGDVGYTIPAEFDASLYHKKGALAAARTNNPEKASSGCQFYIVQGKVYSEAELNQMALQMGITYSAEQKKMYETVGGTPFLDQNYTVFGEVESGMDVIDKIAVLPGDGSNRPFTDVRMKVEVIK